MVAVELRNELQDAHARRPQPTRLSPRRERRLPALHRAPEDEGPLEDALFSRRRPLDSQAAELAALVQDGQCLGRPVDEEIKRTSADQRVIKADFFVLISVDLR